MCRVGAIPEDSVSCCAARTLTTCTPRFCRWPPICPLRDEQALGNIRHRVVINDEMEIMEVEEIKEVEKQDVEESDNTKAKQEEAKPVQDTIQQHQWLWPTSNTHCHAVGSTTESKQ